MFKPAQFFGTSLLALSLFGLGCFQIGPRVVQAPVPVGQVAQTTSTTEHALAYIQLFAGQGTVVRGGNVYKALDGLALAEGDRITATSGTIFLVYPDTGRSRLEAGTEVVILPYGGNTADTKSVGAQIVLITGNIWTRFERVFGSRERFSVSANDVVATVRGTAFGVSIAPDGVDVQVSDHQVDVTKRSANGTTDPSSSIVRLVAGEGLKATAALFAPSQAGTLKQLIRRLSINDLGSAGYLFGIQYASPLQLHAPVHPVHLDVPPSIPAEYQSYAQALSTSFIREVQFAAPTRQPIMRESAPTSGTPSVNGPTP